MKVGQNEVGQPIGKEAAVMANFIGITARNSSVLPINYESWHHMPNAKKNQAVDLIKVIILFYVVQNFILYKHFVCVNCRKNFSMRSPTLMSYIH